MSITQYQVVTPGDLGQQFTWDSATNKWKIIGTGPSTDANNILTTGTDGSTYLSHTNLQGAQKVFTMEYNSTSKKIELSEVVPTAGGGSTTTVVSSVDPISLQGQLDEITITNGSTITFTDQGNPDVSYTADFSSLMGKLTAATNSISLAGDGKTGTELKATLVVDPTTNNLLKVTVAGTKVDKNDVLAMLNAHTALSSTVNVMKLSIDGTDYTANIINSNVLAVDSANSVFRSTINGVAATTPIIELTNSANVHIGFLYQ